MLVLGVDDAHRVVGVDHFDDVLAQVVRRAAELVAQGRVDPRLEVRAADLLPAHADVLGEQVDVGIEVAHVQRQGVLAGQLADLLDRFQAVDARQQWVVLHAHHSSTV
ncbi:hypothetical protein D3C85_1242060 [compost metagenome]